MLKNFVAIAALGGCLLSSAAAAELGTLTGRFMYLGDPPTAERTNVFGRANVTDESLVVDPNSWLANVVIYVRTPGLPTPDAMPDKVHWELKGGRLVPHIVTLATKQTLVVKNSDPFGYNINVQPLGDAGHNPLLAPNQEVELALRREQSIPAPVGCNIHPWIKGYVLPRKNSFAAVSQADGTFKIENLPAQELEFQVWHEKAGYVATPDWPKGRFTLTIKPGQNDLGVIKIDPALFNRQRRPL